MRRVALTLALALAPATAAAQPPGAPPPGAPPGAPPPGAPPGAPPGGAPRPVIQRLAQVVQRRLGLTDDQATRLRATTGRFAAQRQELMVRERDTRRALRDRTEADDSVDQAAIARHLDDLVRIQERRVQLVGEEQRELARFLTPLQRARFLALQERAFRAAQQQRQERQQRPTGGPGMGPGARRPPPP